MVQNKWNELSIRQIEILETVLNSTQNEVSAQEIIETFNELGYPLLYNQPGFHNTFLADIEYNQELIENYCRDIN